MKTCPIVLLRAALACAALPAIADSPPEPASRVSVPAGALGDAVESLANQARVNVIYRGDLLDGRMTAGVDGTMAARDALAKLLQGTPLVLHEDDGAFRIAEAASPGSVATTATAVTAVPAAPSGVWKRRELRIACAPCDFEGESRKLLDYLGASDISASPTIATFLSLTPASEGAGMAVSQPLSAHWKTVTFSPDTRWSRGRARDGALAISPTFYENLRGGVLTLFTTRNLRETDRQLTVDVLVPTL